MFLHFEWEKYADIQYGNLNIVSTSQFCKIYIMYLKYPQWKVLQNILICPHLKIF